MECSTSKQLVFQRLPNNPLLISRPENSWETWFVFNPGALYLAGKLHLLYRAIGESGLSVFGYAVSQDGKHIQYRPNHPAYICDGVLNYSHNRNRTTYTPYTYSSGGSWGGCEDPRLTRIDDLIYMTYTAFGGWNSPPPCVALTSIAVSDFLQQRWHWKAPKLISPPNEMHKNWVLFPEKINGKYALLHSITPNILIDYFDSLDFQDNPNIKSNYQPYGNETSWDSWIRGVAAPPLKTQDGWLVLYHAMDKKDPDKYKLGAMLLDLQQPRKILARCPYPLLEPSTSYENQGYKAGVVYCCGAAIIHENLFIYYGGADTVVCGAYLNLNSLLAILKK